MLTPQQEGGPDELALELFWRATVRPALLVSVIWSLAVWWLGEGLGGMLAGAQSPVTGAPGAVVLYALVAVVAWPSRSAVTEGTWYGDRLSVATGGPAGTVAPRFLWLALWGGLAYEFTLPANRRLSAQFAGNRAGEPQWLRAIDSGFAAATRGDGPTLALALAAVLSLIAVTALLGRAATRIGVALAVTFGLVAWVAGQDLGGIATGTATDPNTGPVLVLLALSFWPLRATAGNEAGGRRFIGLSAPYPAKPCPADASVMDRQVRHQQDRQ